MIGGFIGFSRPNTVIGCIIGSSNTVLSCFIGYK